MIYRVEIDCISRIYSLISTKCFCTYIMFSVSRSHTGQHYESVAVAADNVIMTSPCGDDTDDADDEESTLNIVR